MFLTGLAPNLLALELVKETVNVDITWTQWLVGFLPVGIILLLIGLGGGLVAILLGVFRASKFSPEAVLGVYDGLTIAFLFFWMIGIISSIQRSETGPMSAMTATKA